VRVVCGDDEECASGISRALLQTRALVYTAHPLDDTPDSPGCACGEPSGCTRHMQIECEFVFDSATHYMLIEHAREGAHRVFVRDSEAFEGTIDCTCESIGDGQWVVQLEEVAIDRVSGRMRTLSDLAYPVNMCFCSRSRLEDPRTFNPDEELPRE